VGERGHRGTDKLAIEFGSRERARGGGKSVLAREYAWRMRERYRGVWWVRAEKRETMLDDLIELGARFITRLAEVGDRQEAARATLDFVSATRFEKPRLIVYVNVERPADIEKLTPRPGLGDELVVRPVSRSPRRNAQAGADQRGGLSALGVCYLYAGVGEGDRNRARG
jgi:hypothetical protein